jgi:hypothetical protein
MVKLVRRKYMVDSTKDWKKFIRIVLEEKLG